MVFNFLYKLNCFRKKDYDVARIIILEPILEEKNCLDEKYSSVVSFCEKDWTCAICLSPIEQDQKYKMFWCNHYFHGECITKWIVDKQKNNCPLCKKFIL
tara:strand:- start:82 stop:381 length:300 start_codon:yes stop_codon:yes gene_type:complete